MLTTLLATLFALLAGYLLWRRYRTFQLLREAGHVGPPINYFSGQYFQLNRDGAAKTFTRWFKEFNSDVVAFYYGSRPTLIIQDLELTKQIIIKDFQKFRNRSETLRLEATHPYMGRNVIFTSDDRWKYTRNFITPSFSTVNLREMHARLAKCVDIFMENLSSASGKTFNVYPVLRRLTLDNISRSAFSVKSDVQEDLFGPRPKFQEAAETAFDLLGRSWLNVVIQCFKPLGEFLFHRLHPRGLINHPMDAMSNYMSSFIKLRQASKKDNDWIDFMENLVNAGSGANMEKRKFHKKLGFQLDEKEVTGNCLLFFIAAFETISSSMSFAFFELGKRPDIQRRLRKELRTALDELKEEDLTYDFIMNHPYLDMVVNEVLRMYPVGYGFVARACNEDFEHKGVKIPKGTDVIFPMFTVQRDPRYFPDPETFDPERFSLENKDKIPSMAYLPFGEGQRMCIGKRFGLMEMKHILARMSLTFDIFLDPARHPEGAPVEITDRASVILQPSSGVHIYLTEVEQ